MVGRLAALLAAAMALGLAHNAASPLGIAWRPGPPPAAPVAAPAEALPLPAPTDLPAAMLPQAAWPPSVPAGPAARPLPARPTTPAPAVSPTPPLPRPVARAAPPRPVARPAPLYDNRTLAVEVAAPPPAERDAPPPAGEPSAVAWTQARALVADRRAVLVDARPRAAFQAGSIPGAVSLPYTELEARMPAFRRQYPPDTCLVVFCSDTACATSDAVARALRRDYGFQAVYHMPGGYAEWQQAAAEH